MAPPHYRIDITPSKHIRCQDELCNFRKEKLVERELRLGIWVDTPRSQDPPFWKWIHWGCASGEMMFDIRQAIMGENEAGLNWEALDGYEYLDDEDFKAKVRRCIEQNHIDPEDFKGDPDYNMAGVVGIRSPQYVDRLEHPEKYMDEDGNMAPDNTPSPKILALRAGAAAEKGPVEVHNDDGNFEDLELTQKIKAEIGSKRQKDAASEDDGDETFEPGAEPPKKKTRATRASAAKMKEQSGTEDEVTRGRTTRAMAAAKVAVASKEEPAKDSNEGGRRSVGSPRASKTASKEKEEPTMEDAANPVSTRGQQPEHMTVRRSARLRSGAQSLVQDKKEDCKE